MANDADRARPLKAVPRPELCTHLEGENENDFQSQPRRDLKRVAAVIAQDQSTLPGGVIQTAAGQQQVRIADQIELHGTARTMPCTPDNPGTHTPWNLPPTFRYSWRPYRDCGAAGWAIRCIMSTYDARESAEIGVLQKLLSFLRVSGLFDFPADQLQELGWHDGFGDGCRAPKSLREDLQERHQRRRTWRST